MPAVAEILPTVAPKDPRGCDLPTCPVCADSMVAAEASAYVADNVISYLWTCDTCGYGFVTKHCLRRFACNYFLSAHGLRANATRLSRGKTGPRLSGSWSEGLIDVECRCPCN